jgi:hypothetical protein
MLSGFAITFAIIFDEPEDHYFRFLSPNSTAGDAIDYHQAHGYRKYKNASGLVIDSQPQVFVATGSHCPLLPLLAQTFFERRPIDTPEMRNQW